MLGKMRIDRLTYKEEEKTDFRLASSHTWGKATEIYTSSHGIHLQYGSFHALVVSTRTSIFILTSV